MLDLAIIVLIILGFFLGVRRGFILQLIHMIGFVASFIVAYMYYDTVAPKLRLWIPYPDLGGDSGINMLLDGSNFDEAFYRAIAFVIIFFATRVVLGIIGSALDIVASLPIIRWLNISAGGVLGAIEIYLFIFILLYIAALLPVDSVQTALTDSSFSELILKHTPYFSGEIKKWWIDLVQS